MGFDLIATDGTARYLEAQGIPVARVNKVQQGRPHIVDRIKDGDVALIVNTTEGIQSMQRFGVDPCVRAVRQGTLLHDGLRVGRSSPGNRRVEGEAA